MFPIYESDDVRSGRDLLKVSVDKLREQGLSDQELAVWIETVFPESGFHVITLFNDTAELARFVDVPVSAFSSFFMH